MAISRFDAPSVTMATIFASASVSASGPDSTGAVVFIPDPGTADSPLSSTASGSAATSVAVTVAASHFCGQELRLELVAPNGAVYPRKAAATGARTGYQGGSYTAAGLSAPAAGTWRLRATDTRSWNFGTLNGWSITL